jgi:SSS family transporter
VGEWFTGQPILNSLGAVDLAILAASIAALVGIAYITGRKEQDTTDFFVGGRRVPAIIACLSFLAAEVSAMTIVGVPAVGYNENLQYLQFFIGSAAAKVFIAFLFIPVFYRFGCTTIYQFLQHRFGDGTRYAGSAFFFITRILAAGVRLYVASLGVSVILGCTFLTALLAFSAVSIAFIAFGGIKAVVWTGAYETLVFFLAGGAVAVYLVLNTHGGPAEAWRVADEGGRLSLINLRASLADPNTLWAATIGAMFLNMSVFGTDQDFMQRLLTVRTRRASQRALLGTIVATIPLLTIYLGIGTLLYVFYQQHPWLSRPHNADTILSHFVVHSAPMGVKGLVLAAIVLANIDSPLSSLSASFVTDIYRPLIRRNASERHYLWVARLAVAAFGVILGVLGWAFQPFEGILWVAFQILAVTGGATLGVFLLGLLTKVRADRANVAAMVASALTMTVLLVLVRQKILPMGWTWLIVLGTIETFVLACALAPILDRRR